jgi:hypothetical protein
MILHLSVGVAVINLKIALAVTLPDAWFAILTIKKWSLLRRASFTMLNVYYAKMAFV